jgi:hypothetical protein
LIPPPDLAGRHVFEQGNLVDVLGKKLFPDGVDIPIQPFNENISRATRSLTLGKPLFQAGLKASDLYARTDVLAPTGDGAWEIIDVKSATEVKEEYHADLAFQRHCARQTGLRISGCKVARVNNRYVRKGDIDPHQFFVVEDITLEADAASKEMDAAIAEMLALMASPDSPENAIGPECAKPYDCPLWDSCHSFLPEHHVLTLYYGKKAGYALLSEGIACIGDIPEGWELTPSQKVQRDCVLAGKPHIDRAALRAFLDRLVYPVSYFDFETINPAIPLYDGMRPYQKIPFQFSLVVAPREGDPKRFSFLAKTPADPRPALLAEMKRRLPEQGSIVAYNKAFEAGVLKDLGEAFPDYREWLDGVINRLVDLWEPFKKFHYYHPSQEGSGSMKKVLPALTGRSYDGMEIAEGEAASVLYWNVTHKPAPEADRLKVYTDLEEYCGLDTEGMRLIVAELGKLG